MIEVSGENMLLLTYFRMIMSQRAIIMKNAKNYRDRIVKKGILDDNERGTLKFILPLFEDYVISTYDDLE